MKRNTIYSVCSATVTYEHMQKLPLPSWLYNVPLKGYFHTIGLLEIFITLFMDPEGTTNSRKKEIRSDKNDVNKIHVRKINFYRILF